PTPTGFMPAVLTLCVSGAGASVYNGTYTYTPINNLEGRYIQTANNNYQIYARWNNWWYLKNVNDSGYAYYTNVTPPNYTIPYTGWAPFLAAAPAPALNAGPCPTPTPTPTPTSTVGDLTVFFYSDGTTSSTSDKQITRLSYDLNKTLVSVNLTNSVTSLGDSTFAGSGLTGIYIPSSVVNIVQPSFYSCSSLSSIIVDLNNSTYSSDIVGALFDKQKSVLYKYPSGNSALRYIVPPSTTVIYNYAFGINDKLVDVVLSNSITGIKENAFSLCTKLSGIYIPNSVKDLNGPFYTCDQMTHFTVDANNQTYSSDSNGVLFDKDKIILLQYPVNRSSKYYNIPNTVVYISSSGYIRGFFGMREARNLTTIDIPSSVRHIGGFANCTKLSSINIPINVGTISQNCFIGCGDLQTITIGASLSSIGSQAFLNCFKLNSVATPNSLTYIGNEAFSSCINLRDITLGNSLSVIEGFAFSSTNNLSAAYFLGNAPILGSNVFFNNTKATVYYCSNKTGFTNPFGGRPAVATSPC
ncbi:leucine-rich repeat domain-containing protein, partial [bacterium]|nr:leucine-rich repeat domain-containing protein [bacterium]